MSYADRLSRAQRFCTDHDLAALIIGAGAELAYFTGSWTSSHERLTSLVITPETTRLVAPMTDLISFGSVADLGIEVAGWRDGENPYELATAPIGAGTVALGSSLTANHVLAIQERVDATSVFPAGLFMLKEDAEIAELRRAGRAIDRVHARVPELLVAGRTEREVADDIEKLILEEHDVVDFIIVGSGPNGANPHHDFSDRVLGAGDPVVIDIGGTLDSGYHSDSTRTHVIPGAPAPEDFLQAYAVLQKAKAASVDHVRPGVTAQSVDAAARGPIEAAGYGEYFTHRTGHGIGLSTHEEPFIIKGNDIELAPGMAFSIEPGIYVPGKWGMRIEDIVTVTSDGVERLNMRPDEL